MKMHALTLIAGAALAAGFTSNAIAVDANLAAKYSCKACHAEDRKLVGPSFQEVAAKYAGDASAPAKLAAKIKAGGSGVWGSIPMPPNKVPDADLKVLVASILSQK